MNKLSKVLKFVASQHIDWDAICPFCKKQNIPKQRPNDYYFDQVLHHCKSDSFDAYVCHCCGGKWWRRIRIINLNYECDKQIKSD